MRKIDETRRGFFADISHELRTPLTVIRGEGEIALRGKNKPVAEYKNSIARIVEQAKHLSVLVNDLLFIARQGAGAARLNLQSIDLGDLLEKVCGDAKVIAHPKSVRDQLQQRRGAGFRLWRSGEAPPALHGPARQRRALFERQRRGESRYSECRRRGSGSVADRGIGIAPEELEGIFERFRRGGNATEHNEEGLGLGLPVAKAIVEAHKGRIRNGQPPGRRNDRHGRAAGCRAGGASVNVLLVEDEPRVADFIDRGLARRKSRRHRRADRAPKASSLPRPASST